MAIAILPLLYGIGWTVQTQGICGVYRCKCTLFVHIVSAGLAYTPVFMVYWLCIGQFQLCLRPPPPQLTPRALAFFFLDGKFLGVGTKEEDKCPASRIVRLQATLLQFSFIAQ